MISKEERKAIDAHLAVIAGRNGGVLTADNVVSDAQRPESPLHGLAIWKGWDREKAAHAHWLETARELIREVRVIVSNETTIINAPFYIRDPDADVDDQGYISVIEIRSDEDRARAALVAEFKRVADMLRRAREIARALGMEEDVERLIAGVSGLREMVSAKQPKRRGPSGSTAEARA